MKKSNYIAIIITAIIAIVLTLFNFNKTSALDVNLDSQELAIQEYLNNIDKGNWQQLYQDSLSFANEIDEATYTDYLINLFFDFDLETANYQLIDENLAYYDLLNDNNYLTSFQVKDGKVTTLVTEPNTFNLITPVDYDENANDCKASQISIFEEFENSYQTPLACQFKKVSYSKEYQSELKDGYGMIENVINGDLIIGKKTNDYDQLFIDTASALAKWTTNDGKLSAFSKNVLTEASFYQDLITMDPQWFSSHNISELGNFVLNDQIKIDNGLLANLSFTYKVGVSDLIKEYSITYQMAFLKVNDQYKLANIAINNAYNQ